MKKTNRMIFFFALVISLLIVPNANVLEAGSVVKP